MYFIVRSILPDYWNDIHLSGHDAGVIFIDTEMKFSILRLVNLLEKYILKKVTESSVPSNIESDKLESFIMKCLKNLHVILCPDSEKFVITLNSLESLLANNPNISSIMIDSISAFYWIDRAAGGESVPLQETNMKLATQAIMKLVNTYNLVVFAVKHAVFKKKSQEGCLDTLTDGRPVNISIENYLAQDFDQYHAEFLCKPWQKFVSHRLVTVKREKVSGAENQEFIIGGDCVQGNSVFHVTQTGIELL